MYKVIIVDDEETVRNGINMETAWADLDMLVVASCDNGQSAYEAVLKFQPDIIVSDIRMPVMDGIELLTRLREDGNEAFVIFLTAYSDFSYAQSALKLSAVDYLLKPFEDGALEASLKKVKAKLEAREKSASNGEEPERRVIAIKNGQFSKYTEEALSVIHSSYSDFDLGVKSIAESLSISDGHLSHLFKKETGLTINDYLTRYRIQTSMNLLKDCRIKVYEAAEQCGYRDIRYFSTLFKKITGVSPSDYQNNSK